MAIPKHITEQFHELCEQTASGHTALIETTDKITGEPRYVICAVERVENDETYFTPFALMGMDLIETLEDPLVAMKKAKQP